ncbi:phosphatidylserine decarboxylase [Erythrobacter sp. F6033]|uniref:phosphatidylserine decarboxylase n=1 Tax=Erythrobacter sp. F6033 TaxID=2926401 RepID=UPI001FF46992|nr:phosphatidylserine decarboxylase [Erythrobacter sp. F6033]MCK0128712.1 phosphatidylserine decarboxylase [Erythrobacter sp. F6033]
MTGEILDNQGRGEAGWSWPAIHPEGRKYGVIAVAISLVPLLIFDWEIIGWPMLLLSAGVFAFFRDPERVVPQADNAIIAPADGIVSLITQMEPPEELKIDDGSGFRGLPDGPVTRVSIFMSVFDVHINRAPIAGTVRRLVYIPGKFMNADLDKASEENERQHILIERTDGLAVGFTQIAGLVARRIIPSVKPGDTVAVGQRVGLIRFGSRVDVYLPAGMEPKVLLGQRCIAGETILAEVGSQTGLLEGIAQ